MAMAVALADMVVVLAATEPAPGATVPAVVLALTEEEPAATVEASADTQVELWAATREHLAATEEAPADMGEAREVTQAALAAMVAEPAATEVVQAAMAAVLEATAVALEATVVGLVATEAAVAAADCREAATPSSRLASSLLAELAATAAVVSGAEASEVLDLAVQVSAAPWVVLSAARVSGDLAASVAVDFLGTLLPFQPR